MSADETLGVRSNAKVTANTHTPRAKSKFTAKIFMVIRRAPFASGRGWRDESFLSLPQLSYRL